MPLSWQLPTSFQLDSRGIPWMKIKPVSIYLNRNCRWGLTTTDSFRTSNTYGSYLLSASGLRKAEKSWASKPRRTRGEPICQGKVGRVHNQPSTVKSLLTATHWPALHTWTSDLSSESPRLTTQIVTLSMWQGQKGPCLGMIQRGKPGFWNAQLGLLSLQILCWGCMTCKSPGVRRVKSHVTTWTTWPFPLICKAGI